MKIVVFGRNIPSSRYPTYGIFEWDHAVALKASGVDVIYAYGDYRSLAKPRPWGFEKSVVKGIEVYRLSIPLENFSRGFKLWLAQKMTAWLLNKIMCEHDNIDGWFSHFIEPSAYVTDFLYQHKQLHVVMEHSSKLNQSVLNALDYKLADKVYHQCSQVIAVSKALGDSLNRHFGISPIIIPNIVNTLFTYFDHVVEYPFTFVCTANLVKIKQHELLLKAFKDLNDDSRLIIIGDGPLRSELENLSKSLALDQRVRFEGLITRDEINEIYKYCHCFVLPSQSETFGVAYIEAMAAGLPVIATRCGGPLDFIDESNGLMVNVSDQKGLTLAMRQMIKHYDHYHRENISLQIIEKYSGSRIATLVIRNFLSLLKSKF
jgi:L-malate glycosyltransferase